MAYHACYAGLDALFAAGQTGQKGSLGVVAERAAEGIAQVVTEGGDTRHLPYVGLQTQFLLRISTAAGTPSLTIYKYRGVDLVDSMAYGVHRFDVVYAHEVEPQSVDMVLVDPVAHAFNHKLPHHWLLACSLVAASRTV